MSIEIFTTAYPRSGTTWLNRLLSDLLRSPMQAYNDPVVINDFCLDCDGGYLIRKTHIAGYDLVKRAEIEERGKIVFIHRDPRDVAVSAMFYRKLQPTKDAVDKHLLNTIKTMTDRSVPNQRKYRIYHELGVYEAFVRSWIDGPGNADAVVSYRELHDTPFPALKRVVYGLTGLQLDDGHIAASYARQTFDRWSDKYPHSMRKGIAGDWKNYFKRQHGKYITKHLGRLMLECGYIDDLDWWKELPR